MRLPIVVINSNLYRTLHRFLDIAFERSKIAIFDGQTATYSKSEREFTLANQQKLLIVVQHDGRCIGLVKHYRNELGSVTYTLYIQPIVHVMIYKSKVMENKLNKLQFAEPARQQNILYGN